MKFEIILLSIILTLGFAIRVFNITKVPLYGDELTAVLDGYAILKTGHDQKGAYLPLTFSMGAGRPAGYVYASIPFIALFGPNELGIRLLSLVSGIGLVILAFLIGKRLSGPTGLVAAFLCSISLWDINLSRGGFEAHFALFLSVLAIYFYFRARESGVFLILSSLSVSLGIHTYPTYKLSLALFFPLLIFLLGDVKSRLWKHKKFTLISSLIVTTSIIFALLQTITAGSETRFANINVFSRQDIQTQLVEKINFQRNLSTEQDFLKKIAFNKPIENSRLILHSYLKNFSLDFLVLSGDQNPRHNMIQSGGFYYVEIITILFGLIALWSRSKKIFAVLVTWALVAPIPTALLLEPHFLRSSFLYFPLILLSAVGVVFLKNFLPVKVGIVLGLFLFMSVLVQLLFSLNRLYFLSPQEFSRFWSYPAKAAAQIAIDQKNNYSFIILADKIDNLEYAYPVYAKIDPFLVIEENKKKKSVLGDINFKRWDNVYVGHIPEGQVETFLQALPGKSLYLGPIANVDYLKSYTTVNNLDNLPAFLMVEN